MKSGSNPLAVVIGYGPNHKIASKLVASIFKKPGQQDPVAMEKWFAQGGGDIRQNPSITEAVANFIKRHHAVETVTYDRVYGCPHEEGIDYPLGEFCPHCPFWANVDRQTLDPISLDQPLTPEQILAGLSCERDTQPLKSFEAVELHRARMIEPFLQAVEQGLNNPKGTSPGDGDLFCYALAFLAKWREPRVYPLVIRWLSLPGEGAYDIGGDTASEWSPRMLASVCGGNLEPIKQLILNREANEFCRGAGIEALAVFAAWNERSQQEVADYFGWLAREGLEREPSFVWDNLSSACANIEATSVFDDLRRATEQNLTDPTFMGDELDKAEAEPRGLHIANFRERLEPFDDVAKETKWWGSFSDDSEPFVQPLFSPMDDFGADAYVAPNPYEYVAPKPYIAPPKIGRNDPCPCGSGKKYKKCCGA